MNILLFSPLPTKKDPRICTFVAQRVYELQRQGHTVTALQGGNLKIRESYKPKRKGIVRVAEIVYLHLLILISRFQKKVFRTDFGEYKYYDILAFWSYKAFYRWYRKNGFDLIHAHFLWFSKQLPELKNKLHIPYVVTVHGSDMHELTPYDMDAVAEMRNILNNADKCIFVSRFLLNHARLLGFTKTNVEIIHNGINFTYFYPSKKEKKSEAPLLGFVGNVIFVKQAYILPVVLKIVKKTYPSARLLVLGTMKGDLEPYIKLKTWELGLMDSIDFVPAVAPENVADYMRKIDVLLLPSHNEGFPCVVVEAQACGIGVIGSANGGIPEAVGENGICVKESENFITEYANAIVQWLNHNHDAQKISGSIRGYSWENCVKKEIEIYKTIIAS